VARGILYGLADNSSMRRGLFGLVTAVATALLIFFALTVQEQLQRLGKAASDNMIWVFSRGEIESMTLRTAVERAAEQDEPDLDDLRRAFDVLYSRLRTLEESDAMDALRADPRFAAALDRLSEQIALMLPVIDSPDTALQARLPALIPQTREVHDAMRAVSLTSVALYSAAGDARRAEVAAALQRIGFVTAILFLMLLIMANALMRLLRTQEDNATALRKARDAAIEGERSKAHMLAVMSHEMRTPLNGIVGALELIDPDTLPADTLPPLRMARSAADQLIGHVEDVLDITRLEAGRMQSTARPFDLVALMQEVIDSQMAAATARGNSLVLRPPHPDLHQCFGDAGRVQQILLNFIGNAIKFTKDGTITLEADCSNGLEAVEVSVSDTGIGIAEQDLARIFDDFVTLDVGYDRTNGGTGLGLGIVKRLAEALGGTVGAESEPGEGSLFWVRLPLQERHREVETLPDIVSEPPPLPPMRVLVVEDNASNRMILRSLLEKMGHRVSEAADGCEGLKAAQQGDFDAILMDISMPVMDGVNAARAIRDEADLAAPVPIIATTALARPEDHAEFEAAGIQGVLTKPLTRAALHAALSTVFTKTPVIPQTAAIQEPRGLLDQDQFATLRETMPRQRLQRALHGFRTEMDAFSAASQEGVPNASETHRMAGSAALFGAADLATHLRRMCDSAKLNDAGTWQQQVRALGPLWEQTKLALTEADTSESEKIARGQD
jgi:signal transduction histidine kinase/DNA-binding response OmpR family regulator